MPVCPAGVEARFHSAADDFVCVMQPDWFMGIGQFYADFTQTSDEEVRTCLDAARLWQQKAMSGDVASKRAASPEDGAA